MVSKYAYRLLVQAICTVWALTILLGCASSAYRLVNERAFDRIQNPDGRKFILLQGHYPDIATLVQSFNKRHWNVMSGQLLLINDKPTRDFLQAARLLAQGQYPLAYDQLKVLPDTSFHCQAWLLKTDCLKEMHADSVDYDRRYQQIVDCSPDPRIKSLANTRYRYYKYGY